MFKLSGRSATILTWTWLIMLFRSFGECTTWPSDLFVKLFWDDLQFYLLLCERAQCSWNSGELKWNVSWFVFLLCTLKWTKPFLDSIVRMREHSNVRCRWWWEMPVYKIIYWAASKSSGQLLVGNMTVSNFFLVESGFIFKTKKM